MHNLNAQPNLLEATSQKRFKGCYLLESVKVKITNSGWPVRIAVIKDVEDKNVLELRLLGDSFLALNVFTGDYIQLEAAIKRYRNGQFYYLAWYEPVIDLAIKLGTHGKNTRNRVSREECLQTLEQRIALFSSRSEQSLCSNILKRFSHDFSISTLQTLCKKLTALDNDEFIVELAYQVEMQSNDICSIGKTLSQLLNRRPYHIWEQRLLGN